MILITLLRLSLLLGWRSEREDCYCLALIRNPKVLLPGYREGTTSSRNRARVGHILVAYCLSTLQDADCICTAEWSGIRLRKAFYPDV